MAIEKTPNVPPFVSYCAQLIPTVFDNSLSYYEALAALAKWMQDNLVDVINNNATVTEQYIQMTEELKAYVENYFDNLDVQEEINNKLDQMAEDGTLKDMIALVNASKEVYPESFGAVGDGTTDDTQALQDAIDYAYTNKVNVRLGNKTYKITEPLLIYGNPDPAGKATEIEGNGIGKSIIVKTTNTTKADANGNSFDAIFIVSKQESGVGAHNIRIENMSLIGNGVSHYGIAEKIPLVGSELKRLSIENFTDAGIYCIGNTYLDKITQVRCTTCATGFYIYGGINTSLVLANCYAVSCTNGYKMSGSYSQLDSPACDGATGIAYDLQNFRGTVISAGCESINAETVFNFNGSYCTLINPLTFPNYDNADAFHVKLGAGSHITVIGGRMLWDALGRNVPAEGGFVDNGYLSNIVINNTLVGSFKKKSAAFATAATSSKNIQTEFGNVNTYGDERLIYIGADGRSTSGLVKTGRSNDDLQATAIFMGGGYDKWQTYNGLNMGGNRSPMLGDIYLSKRPNEIGGIGWIQTADATNTNWKTNTMKKIPIVQSGATSDRPIYEMEVGQQFYDTTLNKPVWCKTIGEKSTVTFTFNSDAASAGTITFTIFGIPYSVDVTAGESAASIRSKFLAITSTVFQTVEQTATSVRYIQLAYKSYSSTPPTLDLDGTGAGITEAHTSGSNAVWVDATGTTV